jgi:hypothetical protein
MAGIAKPKPAPKAKGKKLTAPKRRKLLEKEVESLMRELVWWRDGSACVMRHIDGARCGGGIQWVHFIARSKSAYLVYILGNTFCGCANHNGLDHWGDDVMSVWFSGEFGSAAHKAIWQEARDHVGKKPAEWELQEWIDELKALLYNRPAMHTPELLIELGYYGKWPKGKQHD